LLGPQTSHTTLSFALGPFPQIFWPLVSPFLSSLAYKSSQLTFATTSPGDKAEVKASQQASAEGGKNWQTPYNFSTEPKSGYYVTLPEEPLL